VGDTGDDFKIFRDYLKARRDLHGVPCPECVARLPKASPSILLPGQRCRIHKSYQDPRQRDD
jgi:hypothetical protein